MLTQEQQSIQVSSPSPRIWDRATTAVSIGDYIRAPHTPVMRVIDKDIYPNGQVWLLVKPNSGSYTEEWLLETEEAQIPSEEETEEEQGNWHGRYDADKQLQPIYTEATCQYSTGYLKGYNSTPTPQQTKAPAKPPAWSVVYDGEYWYKVWVGDRIVGKASTHEKAERLGQKYIANSKARQEHRERVLAAYAG